MKPSRMDMRHPAHIGLRWLGIIASLAAAIVAVTPAFIHSNPTFSPSTALQLIEVLAIIWTVVFAAENVRMLVEARVDEYRPLLTILPRYKPGRRPAAQVQVLNLGKGSAVELDVVAWWRDADQTEWLPHHLPDIPAWLRPGEAGTTERPVPWTRFLLHKEQTIHMIVEVSFRDASGGIHRKIYPFRWVEVRNEHQFIPVDSTPLPNLSAGGKRELLQKYATGLSTEFGLHEKGFRLVPEVVEDWMRLSVYRGDELKFLSNGEREESVYRIVDNVAEFLRTHLAAPNPNEVDAALTHPDAG